MQHNRVVRYYFKFGSIDKSLHSENGSKQILVDHYNFFKNVKH